MGKKVKEQEQNTAKAINTHIRTSPQKLNLVAATIRGVPVAKALADLTFLNKAVAKDVKKTLQSAVANAENNHSLDVDRLYVKEAYVGKTLVMKRYRARSQGRAFKIQKPFSRLTVVVAEQDTAAKEAA